MHSRRWKIVGQATHLSAIAVLVSACGGGGGDAGSTTGSNPPPGATNIPPPVINNPPPTTWSWKTPSEFQTSTTVAHDATLVKEQADAAVLAWVDSDGATLRIYSARLTQTPTPSWTTPAPIDLGGETVVLNPGSKLEYFQPNVQLSSAHNGKTAAVWVSHDGVRTNLWTATYDAGSGWSQATALENTSGNTSNGDISINDQGDAAAIWLQDNGGSLTTYVSRGSAGGTWTVAEAFDASTGNADAAHYPHIEMDATGTATAAWVESDGTRPLLWATQNSGTTWATPVQLSNNAVKARMPQMIIGHDNNVHVVWIEDDGAGTETVRYRRYVPANAAWGPIRTVETKSGKAYAPTVVETSDQRVMVAWVNTSNEGNKLLVANYADDGSFSTPVAINTVAVRIIQPRFSTNAAGQTLLVWGDQNGWYSLHDNASGWAKAKLITWLDYATSLTPVLFDNGSAAVITAYESASKQFVKLGAYTKD